MLKQLHEEAAGTHLVADTQRHLGNLNVDERIVHRGSLLHLINVVDWMLERFKTNAYFTVLFNVGAKTCEASPPQELS